MKIELKKLIDNLDAQAKVYLEEAIQHTISRSGHEILIEDILYCMLTYDESVFNKVLEQYKIDKSLMSDLLVKQMTTTESSNPIFSPSLISWIEDTFLVNKLELGLDKMSELSLIYALFEHHEKYLVTDYLSLFPFPVSIESGIFLMHCKTFCMLIYHSIEIMMVLL